MRDLILKMLREKPHRTNVLRNKLEYDHDKCYKLPQVRSRLYQMKDEGLVRVTRDACKSNLIWEII